MMMSIQLFQMQVVTRYVIHTNQF